MLVGSTVKACARLWPSHAKRPHTQAAPWTVTGADSQPPPQSQGYPNTVPTQIWCWPEHMAVSVQVRPRSTADHLVVVAPRQQADVVHHGDAGRPELDGTRHEVMPRVALQRAVVLHAQLTHGSQPRPQAANVICRVYVQSCSNSVFQVLAVTSSLKSAEPCSLVDLSSAVAGLS